VPGLGVALVLVVEERADLAAARDALTGGSRSS
jgi:hypothetical protein